MSLLELAVVLQTGLIVGLVIATYRLNREANELSDENSRLARSAAMWRERALFYFNHLIEREEKHK